MRRLVAVIILICMVAAMCLSAVTARSESPVSMIIAKNIAGSTEKVPEKARERTDKIIIGTPDLFGVTNPLFVNTQGDTYAASLMFDELVFFDEYGVPGNGLADAAVSADGLTYTFAIKPARYSDTALVTSDDFINTLYILTMPGFDGNRDLSRLPILGLEAYLDGVADIIVGINRLGDSSFSVTLTRPHADALELLAIPALRIAHFGSAIRPEGLGAVPEACALWYEARLADIKASEAYLAGYGQYDLVSMEKGVGAEFAANADYWRAKPSVGSMELLVVPVGQEYEAIMSGDVDIIKCCPDTAQIDMLYDEGKGFVSMYTWLGDTIGYLGFNGNNPVLGDYDVRQAIARGLDRQAIIRAVKMESYAKVPGMFLFDTFSKSADILGELYPCNPVDAAEILDNAGWVAGEDGTRVKNGKPLEFTVYVPAENPMANAFEAEMYKMADALSMRLTVEKIPFEQWLAKIEDGTADAYLAARRLPASPAAASSAFVGDNPLNNTGFSSDSAKRFVNWSNLETNKERQLIVYEGLYQQLYIELAVIPIYRRHEFLLVNARVRNFYISSGHDITAEAYRMIVTTNLGNE